MSGLDKIIAEINTDAKESARHEIEKANKEAEALIKETEEIIAAKKAEYEKQAEAKRQDILERAKSSLEFENRKAILNKKQELINKAIEEAKNRLSSLSPDEYFAVLSSLAKKYADQDKAVMKLCKNDLDRLPSDFEKSLPSVITLSKESVNIKNGFILIYEGIDINCSFDALFEDKEEELQDKAASILFK